MGAWGWMECKAGHGSVSGYRGMLVDARGRCALGGGGDTKGCRRLQVDAGGCGGLYNSLVAINLSMCTKLNIYI